MKHLKMLGLFVMTAAALMAFVGSASAAGTFTAPSGTVYIGQFSATLEGSSLLKAGFAEITCTTGTIAGKFTTNNEEHVTGPITSIGFSSCGSSTVDTINNNGTLTINKSNTEVTGTGTEITYFAGGVSCVYGFGALTSLGRASNTASGVTLALKAKLTTLGKQSILCATQPEWTANYIITVPTGSVID